MVGARHQRQSQSSATWATPTSAPRSTPTTSRPPTRTSSATIRSSTWAHLSAETATTTIPARNPLADLGPSNLQTSSISQYRTLTNTGVHADYSYVKGINNLKIGAQYEQTFLREHDNLGVVDSTYNSPCVDAGRQPAAGLLQSIRLRRRYIVPERQLPPGSRALRPHPRRHLLSLLRPHRRKGAGPLR